MNVELTRRSFIQRSAVTAVGAYVLLDSLGSSVARAAVNGATGNSTVVTQWNSAALEAIRETHPGPPMVARALAMVHTSIFDAWAAYDANALPTQSAGFVRRPDQERTPANRREALSYAAYRTLVDLYPGSQQVAEFDALMASLGYDPSNTGTDPSTPSGVGNRAAAALLAFRHTDGSNQLGGYADTSGYVSVNDPDHINDPNRWQPLRVPDGHGGSVVQKYIAPHWGGVKPFALTSSNQFLTDSPATVDDSLYEQQARQILHYSARLNDRQKVIAEYWADGPRSELPPGHWCLFAQYVSQRDNHDLDADVKMFFALTNANFDASIACWDAKRVYDSVRPVTAIHYLFADNDVRAWAGPYKGTRRIKGRDWTPYQAPTVVTPPFPEYLSGHSTFSAAGAEILRRFTGSDRFGASYTQPARSSRVEPLTTPANDLTLTWRTFSHAADEAGISRRYGGIHFEQGDLDGRAMGRAVGAQAWDRAQSYISGATPDLSGGGAGDPNAGP